MARDATSVEVCAFDMFGTLFDVHSVVAACRDAFGEEGEDFDALWRRKQLQYSWLRGLMGRYVPFSRVTRDALDTALSVFDRSDDDELRERLMAAYGEVSPYPDARPALRALEEAGVRRVILTNGSRDMVSSTLAAADFEGLFERVFSVEEVETFKPHPEVYRMACRELGLEPERIVLVSSHPWDLAGAVSFGLQGAWVDRPGGEHHLENLGHDPDHVVHGLTELVDLLAPASAG